jgi:hypothetical protein
MKYGEETTKVKEGKNEKNIIDIIYINVNNNFGTNQKHIRFV